MGMASHLGGWVMLRVFLLGVLNGRLLVLGKSFPSKAFLFPPSSLFISSFKNNCEKWTKKGIWGNVIGVDVASRTILRSGDARLVAGRSSIEAEYGKLGQAVGAVGVGNCKGKKNFRKLGKQVLETENSELAAAGNS